MGTASQEREALGRRVAATEQKYFAKVMEEMAELGMPSGLPVEVSVRPRVRIAFCLVLY